MQGFIRTCLIGVIAAAPAVLAQSPTVAVELTQVEARPLEKTIQFPGELKAYQAVDVYAKVTGFVEAIPVDRSSRVRAGDLLAEMSAPEIQAQRAEAEAKIPALAAQKAEAEARLAGAESTLERLREAAKTPGVVAGNDVILAEKTADAVRSAVEALAKSMEAAEATVRAVAEMEKYLRITAPFDGIITERLADPGSLVGPQGGGSPATAEAGTGQPASVGGARPRGLRGKRAQRTSGQLYCTGAPGEDVHRHRCSAGPCGGSRHAHDAGGARRQQCFGRTRSRDVRRSEVARQPSGGEPVRTTIGDQSHHGTHLS